MDKLILRFKDSVIKEYPVEKDIVTIGRRSDNDIPIDNQVVSGLHARIMIKGGMVMLEDMQSTNGTLLNDQRTASSVLNNNDVITIGKHTITFITDRPRMAAPAKANTGAADLDKTMVLGAGAARPAGSPSGGAAAVQSGGALGVLLVIEGDSSQKEYELKGRLTTIGKAESANIKLKGFLTPKTAALINRAAEGYYLSPPTEGSKAKINGNPLKERVALKDGDQIELYGLKLQFVMSR